MKVGGEVLLPKSKCLNCGYDLDACTVVDTDKTKTPKEGDVTLCINCGYIMAFDDKQSLRELTGDEMHIIAGDKHIIAVGEAIAQARKARGNLQK